MAHREGRPRNNEFRLPHVRDVFPVTFGSATNENRVGLELNYMACVDYTEVTIPQDMWYEHSKIKGSSGVSLGSPFPQSGNANRKINGAIDINQISAGIMGANEKSDHCFERKEHATQKVVLLPVVRTKTNGRRRLTLKRTCILNV